MHKSIHERDTHKRFVQNEYRLIKDNENGMTNVQIYRDQLE